MKDSIPDDSDELFDSSGSGEVYVPASEASEEDSDASSIDLKKLLEKEKNPPTSSVMSDLAIADSTLITESEVTNEDSEDAKDDFCLKTQSSVKPSVHVPNVKNINGKRAYNKRHYCLYCEKPCSKFARHLQSQHSEESAVFEAFSFPKGSKKRKLHLDYLRNQGNFAHNAVVIKKGEGELVPSKQPTLEAKGDDYMHCAYCKGLFMRRLLWRHIKVCSFCTEERMSKRGKNKVQALCSFAEPTPSNVSQQLWKVLSAMQCDQITVAVKNDSCILQMGEHLLNKKGTSAASQTHTRQNLRELGRLLITARRMTNLKTMKDFINPRKYMEVIQAVKVTCGYDETAEKYRIPSLAKKLGIALSKLSKLVKAQALMAGDKILEERAKGFEDVHAQRWNELVSATAARNISEAKWNLPTVLPFTEDVQKLHAFLNKRSEACSNQLSADPSQKSWSELTRVALTEIILFNRRREGEVSKMVLSSFLSRDISTPHEDIDWALSEVEKTLCQHFSRVVIRGKRGRPVPILLTPTMLNVLNLLVKTRDSCGILKENHYVFARPSSMTHFRGSDCLRSFALACNAMCPKALTSTKLRKHAATLSTVLNMSNTEMDQLANFLGHDIRVHREFYRLPEKTLQLAKVSKVLLALEQGKMADFQGKSLDEIDIHPSGKSFFNYLYHDGFSYPKKELHDLGLISFDRDSCGT